MVPAQHCTNNLWMTVLCLRIWAVTEHLKFSDERLYRAQNGRACFSVLFLHFTGLRLYLRLSCTWQQRCVCACVRASPTLHFLFVDHFQGWLTCFLAHLSGSNFPLSLFFSRPSLLYSLLAFRYNHTFPHPFNLSYFFSCYFFPSSLFNLTLSAFLFMFHLSPFNIFFSLFSLPIPFPYTFCPF